MSSLALLLALLAPLCAVSGAWLANRAHLSPYEGFRMFLTCLPLALAAALTALLAQFLARGDRNRAARRKGFAGLTIAIVTISAVIGLAAPGANYPVINDITTDVEDPPQFVAAVGLQGDRGVDMSYRPGFAEQQKRAYPTLASEVLSVLPEQAFERARAAVESLPNTRVIDASLEEGRIEAIAVSRVFHFVDDIVVRIRPLPGGTRIDIRSRSRDGRGDFGVNAQRIENFLTVLQ